MTWTIYQASDTVWRTTSIDAEISITTPEAYIA